MKLQGSRVTRSSSVKDSYDPNVFFNNIGVIYEAIGDTTLARAYYIKSLGKTCYSSMGEFLEINAERFGVIDNSILPLCFYLAQSTTVIFGLLSVIFIFFLLD